jgi:acyl-CoA thioester hydrolase
MTEPERFVHRLRVRFAECDPQGVVFNAHLLAYLDHGLTELWRAAFGGYATMTDRGLDVVVAEAQLRFRAPARFDEELDVGLAVAELGTTSMTLEDRIVRAGAGGELVLEARMRYVWIETADGAKTPIPDWARAGLAPYRAPTGAG